MIIEENERKFMGIQKYVKYIKDGKMKINCFLCGLQLAYKNQIHVMEPCTLEELVHMEKYCEK
jgi:hypothetical protein